MTTHTLKSPLNLRANISLPASKSISARALIISALAAKNEILMPNNLSDCDDTFVMKRALTEKHEVCDIMAAGTAMRFLSAYFAVKPGLNTITGTERMCHRPIGILVDALRTLGAEIEYAQAEGFPPLIIKGGKICKDYVEIAGNVSSQYISALLMIAPNMEKGLTLKLTGKIVSLPYIEMTLSIMRNFGAKAEWTDDSTICVQPIQYTPTPFSVESDWSAASYWYEMVALSNDEKAEIHLPLLSEKSLQGDSAVKDFFLPLGVSTRFENGCAVISKTKSSEGTVELNLQNQPDLAQTLVVTCAMLKRQFKFTGVQSLKIKETDRILALQNELAKLGFVIKEENNGETILWDGETCNSEATAINTYEDHRMAMAFAPCSLVRNDIRINNPEVVSKSYPKFWHDLEQAGFSIQKN